MADMGNRSLIGVVSLVGVLAFATRASGVTINVPAAYSTIQAGIDAASDGDIVLVADGVYSENISFNGKNIRVVSAGGASSCTINGGGVSEVVKFMNNETRSAVLEGFTLTNGYGHGGGVRIDGASPTVLDCIIRSEERRVGKEGSTRWSPYH